MISSENSSCLEKRHTRLKGLESTDTAPNQSYKDKMVYLSGALSGFVWTKNNAQVSLDNGMLFGIVLCPIRHMVDPSSHILSTF